MAEIENLQIVGGAIYTVGNQDIIADDWEAGKAYIKDRSYAIKDHKLYQCAVSHTSVEPFDPTKWTEKTVAEALGTAGSANMIECTLAEYTAWKAGGQLINETVYVITDAPNLNATAQDISYDGGADTVWDKVEALNGKVAVIDVIPNITMLNNYTLANSRLIKVGQMLVGILEISRSTAFVNNEAMATLPYYDSNFNIIIPSFCSTTDRWNAITPCNVFINNSNGNLIYAGANSNVKFVRVPFAIALP